MCKNFKSIIWDHIIRHLAETRLLTQHQHGFTKNKLKEILHNCQNLDAVYLDLSKAFDSLPHQCLLMKLEVYGIRGNLLAWIEDFLVDRNQPAVINGMKSLLALVLSIIRQESVLGPLLFILFVNDMPDVVKSHIQMFAYHTKLYSKQPN